VKIAIQSKIWPFKESFSERWIAYCENNHIEYKIVDCYKSDIIAQLKDCDIFMWHYHHASYRDVLFAKQLLYACEVAGIGVFPDFTTSWHFDDKVGQKYLLEAIGAPLVKTHVFYEKERALEWVRQAVFPKVFKLRTGAGSMNVKLVANRRNAASIVRKAFSLGFCQYDRWGQFKERCRRFREGQESILAIPKGLARSLIVPPFARRHAREKGYVLFQDFIANNMFDIRVVVVGERAFALKRMVRKNDFRASGSGTLIYGRDEIDERCVQIGLDVNKKLNAQSIAYDFVFDEKQTPLIVEISFGYAVKAYDFCPGYWDKNLGWHEGSFNPQEWMIEDLIRKWKSIGS
jgi:hypothetical protein